MLVPADGVFSLCSVNTPVMGRGKRKHLLVLKGIMECTGCVNPLQLDAQDYERSYKQASNDYTWHQR